jgi:hypothetical protein
MSSTTADNRTAFSNLRKFFAVGLAMSAPALLATGCGPDIAGPQDEAGIVLTEIPKGLATQTLALNDGSWTFHNNNNPGFPLFPSSTEAFLLPDNRYSAAVVAFYKQDVSPPYTVEFEYLTFDDDAGSTWNSADGVVLMVGKNRETYASRLPPAGGSRGFIADGTGYGVHFNTFNNRGIFITNGYNTPLNSISDSSTYTHNTWRKVRVDVQPQGITVFVDGSQRLAWTGTVSTQFKGMGLGAATGGSDSEHRIRNVKLTTSPGETCPASAPGPTLTITGSSQLLLECGQSAYADPGAVAYDGCGNALEVHKYNSGQDAYGPGPNTSAEGTYSVQYLAMDAHGRTVSAIRTVQVDDRTAPTLRLLGSASMTHTCGSQWVDPGVTALDACYGNVAPTVHKVGEVNGWVPGVYTVRYELTDSGGNAAQSLQRTVQVTSCPW